MPTTISQSSEPKPRASAQRKTKASGSRTYITPEGKEYPSVTTILGCINKPALVPWAAKMERILVSDVAAELFEKLPISGPKFSRAAYLATLERRVGDKKKYQKELDKASSIGTQVHNRIEWLLRQLQGQKVGAQPPLERDEALWAYMTFEDFQQQHQLQPIFLEQVLWSNVHGYAGTTDWIARVDGVVTVGDWKTGKAIYPEAWLQASAYAMAGIEMGHFEPPINACIVRLPKTYADPAAEIKIIPWEQVQECFQAFLAALQLFQWQAIYGGTKK